VEAGIYSSKRSLTGLFFHSPDFLLFQVASAVYVFKLVSGKLGCTNWSGCNKVVVSLKEACP
jgi:hypothetical protein